ncbi:hypothetical protein CFC21_090056 [Triticum aestivum]|uniref:Uncharacterized protein n=2 Tax=Triticum aestivum TaxID=4565 RepID=A0A9R1INA1_WHEAT|nr:hypothetical protein CFC21_090056 [Triticum aestivum]
MRTTQMLLLSLVFLMLASDVVVEASMDDSMKLIHTCVHKILPLTKPCDSKTCEKQCVKRTRQTKSSMCVLEGCRCSLCIDPAPTIHDNEQMGTN